MRTNRVSVLLIALLLIGAVGTASAQNFSTDARKIAMGGNGGDTTNIAAGMVDKASPYTSIVLPLGLFQLFADGFDKFRPDNPAFNPIQAIENASNPLHYTFGRDASSGTSGSTKFVNDLRNGTFNSNLLTYTGFKIPTTFRAQGVGMPEGGHTFRVGKKTGTYTGIYFGAGPYLAFDTQGTFAQQLVDMLGTGTAALCPAATGCNIANATNFEAGMAITLGYRQRVAMANAKDARDGVYFAYNYHILRGFQYVGSGLNVRLDTDAPGHLGLPPITNPPISPIAIGDTRSTHGTGHASDVGVIIVKNSFEVGFGVNGIGNQINWTDLIVEQHNLTALQGGAAFVDTRLQTTNSLIVKQPIVISESLAFTTGSWGFMGSLAQKTAPSSSAGIVGMGYDEKSFNAGIEHRVGPLWLRGGGRRSREKWDPTYGFGIGTKVALDFGFYGTHANLEGKRQTAMAVSVRFNHAPKSADTTKGPATTPKK